MPHHEPDFHDISFNNEAEFPIAAILAEWPFIMKINGTSVFSVFFPAVQKHVIAATALPNYWVARGHQMEHWEQEGRNVNQLTDLARFDSIKINLFPHQYSFDMPVFNTS